MNIIILTPSDLLPVYQNDYQYIKNGKESSIITNPLSYKTSNIKLVIKADLVVYDDGQWVKIIKNRFDGCWFMFKFQFYRDYLPQLIEKQNKFQNDLNFYNDLSEICTKYNKTVITSVKPNNKVIK